MITFLSIIDNTLKLKPIAPYRFCPVCVKDAVEGFQYCPECFHPYDNNESLLEFDYDDYRQHSNINLDKAIEFFSSKAVLNQCRFCGCDPVLNWKSVWLYQRFYGEQYKGSVTDQAFYVSCTGCTLSTPLLYAYLFYVGYMQLVYAWNSGQSRHSLIKYVDLRLPDWSMNYHNLKRIKDYAEDYLQHSQQSLFLL